MAITEQSFIVFFDLMYLDKLHSLSLKHLLTSSSRFETLLLEYTGTDHSKVKKIIHLSPVLTLLTDLKSGSFSVYVEKQVAIDQKGEEAVRPTRLLYGNAK